MLEIGVDAKALEQLNRTSADFEKKLVGALREAAQVNISPQTLSRLKRQVEHLNQSYLDASAKVLELDRKMREKTITAEQRAVLEITKKEIEEKLKGLQEESKERLQMAQKLKAVEAQLALKNYSEEHARQLKDAKMTALAEATAHKRAFDKVLEDQKKKQTRVAEAQKELGLGGKGKLGKFARVSEKAGEGIGDVIKDVQSKDLGSFAGILKKMGAGAKTAGAATAESGGMLGGLGQILTKLGPALTAIGGIAAGFAAVAKVIVDADAQAKEFNRTLMENGVAAGDMQTEFKGVTESLDTVREAFTSFSFNRLWGTTAKDHLQILAAYSQAGLTFKELTAGAKDSAEEIDRLQKATASALTYSKLLGMTTTEVATSTADYMEELGLSLSEVQEKFSAIAVVAKESGFATKRFMGMLLQATSGMSMYNVRLDETAGLLTQLGKILGQKMSGDFVQQLTKGFKDEGTQDRVKKTMTTGLDFALKISQKGAIKTASDFQTKLASLGKESPAAAEGIRSVLASAGITGGEGPEEFAKKLGKMSGEEQAKVTSQARAMGGKEGESVARMLGSAIDKSLAFRGGLGGAQAARQFSDPAEVLVLQLNEIRGVLHKSLDEIDLTDEKSRMAWESITGKSGEAAMQLFKVGQEFRGRESTIKQFVEKLKKSTDPVEMAQQFNESFGKAWKISMKETGEIFDETGAKLDTTAESLILATGAGELSKAAVPEDIRLAQEVASNTTDMTKILEQGVEALLASIDESVSYIADLLGLRSKGLKGKEAEAKASALKTLQSELSTGSKSIFKQERLLAGKQKELGSTMSKEAREKLVTEIEQIEKGLKVGRAALKVKSAQISGLRNVTSTEGLANPEDASAYLTLSANKARGTTRQQLESVLSPEARKMVETAAKVAGETAFEKTIAAGGGLARGAGGKGYAAPKAKAAAEEQIYQLVAESLGMPTGGTAEVKLGNLTGTTVMPATSGKEGKPIDALLKDQTTQEKRIQEVLQKKEFTFYEKQPVEIGNQVAEALAREKLASLLASKGGFGGAEAMGMAKTIRGGQIPSMLSPEVLDLLEANKELTGAMGASALRSGAQDLVMQIGSGGVKFAQRVDPGDVGVFSKPGGALSKAGGGGSGTTNVYHMYNDGPGVLQTITKAQQAGVLK
jgi:hypothetical protein